MMLSFCLLQTGLKIAAGGLVDFHVNLVDYHSNLVDFHQYLVNYSLNLVD